MSAPALARIPQGGVCASGRYNADLWSSTLKDEVRFAKAVCARCPVRAECATVAIETGQDFGVWGGLDMAEDARAIRRARRKGARTA